MYLSSQSTFVKRNQEEREDPRRSLYNRDQRYDSSSTNQSVSRPSRDRPERSYEDSYDENRRQRRFAPAGREKDTGHNRWDRPPAPRRDQRGGSRSRSRSPPSRSDPRVFSPSSRTQPIPSYTSESTSTGSTFIPPHTLRENELQGNNGAVVTPMSTNIPSASHSGSSSYSSGLDAFDITGFDETNAASWMTLGNAFRVAYGRDGSQEELVATYMAMKSGLPVSSVVNVAPVCEPTTLQENWQDGGNVGSGRLSQYSQQAAYVMPSQRINTWETREQDDLKRGGRQVGHGSYDGGVGYAIGQGRWQTTDAIVLTGNEDY
ncbi:hypothetical protein CPB86DRAFT_159511 [Serendipita vermifera]|nr:hypothetical protein CPB86DRAFT_159511 [Serendipita vermifera]